MRVLRTTAATLLILAVAGGAAAAGRSSAHAAPLSHTCSLADKHFIQSARLSMFSVGSWSDDYLRGEAKASEVIAQADNAVLAMRNTQPEDPTLRRASLVLRAMFGEYADAVAADAHGHRPGRHIYRAYGLANFAHDLLVQARPALEQHGCDVSPLL